MGTGVGEAMLIGAAVGATAGGAGAAIQGGDPLKGALTGGAMGAVGGGLGAGFGAAGGATEGALSGATSGSGAGAGAGTGGGFGLGATGPVNTGIGSIYAGAPASIQGATNLGAGISGAGTAGGFGLTAPTTAASLGGAGAGGATGAGAGTGANIFGYTPGQAGYLSNTQLGMTAGTAALAGATQAQNSQYGIPSGQGSYDGPLSKLGYDPEDFKPSNPQYAPTSVYRPTYAAEGGIMKLAAGGMPGPVERMSQNVMGGQANMYPLSQQEHTNFATPTQMPTSAEIIRSDYDAKTDPYTGVMMARGGIARYDLGGSVGMGIPNYQQQQQPQQQTAQPQGLELLMRKKRGMMTPEQAQSAKMQGLSPAAYKDIYGQAEGLAAGGISSLGSYSDGGRMLKGPGDGMSDNIPATIGGKQPARLADGEFVVPADVVSHLGNGSTDAGAKQLYSMMDKVRKARTGSKKQGKQINPQKYLAA